MVRITATAASNPLIKPATANVIRLSREKNRANTGNGKTAAKAMLSNRVRMFTPRNSDYRKEVYNKSFRALSARVNTRLVREETLSFINRMRFNILMCTDESEIEDGYI